MSENKFYALRKTRDVQYKKQFINIKVCKGNREGGRWKCTHIHTTIGKETRKSL